MVKHYYKKDYEDDDLSNVISGIIVFYAIFLISDWYVNRAEFWRWVVYGFLVVLLIILIIFLKKKYKNFYEKRLISNVKLKGQEEYLNNFINRFGSEGKNNGWNYRNYNFSFDRICDLEKVLRESGVKLGSKDIYLILRYYIGRKEEKITRASIVKEPSFFSRLTGTEFEKLLNRLFESMGYTVQLIGKTGDQGGDLIANKNGERILIQAKCYKDWSVGNSAVQQVTGALKFYDCSKAMVVCTSYFTPEAVSLAKANGVELMSKNRVSELCLEYLHENWS